jgi:hypothetical protein
MEGSLVAYKVFTNGSVVNASEINDNLMNQSVMVFSNSSARSAAIISPVEGMLTWLEDLNRYEYRDGSGAWVELISLPGWIAYTPTFTNMTIGNATIRFRYSQIGKIVVVQGDVVFGSTTSISGIPVISLPVTASSLTAPSTQIGGAYAEDAGITGYPLMIRLNNANNLDVLALGAASTYVNSTPVASNVPFTWGTNDLFRFTATYEAA